MAEVRPGLDDLVPPTSRRSSRRWDLKQKVLWRATVPLRLPVPVHQPLHVSADARQGAGGLFYGWKADSRQLFTICVQPAARAQSATIAPRPPSLRSQRETEDEPFCAVCSA
jgi:hypothetical protein